MNGLPGVRGRPSDMVDRLPSFNVVDGVDELALFLRLMDNAEVEVLCPRSSTPALRHGLRAHAAMTMSDTKTSWLRPRHSWADEGQARRHGQPHRAGGLARCGCVASLFFAFLSTNDVAMEVLMPFIDHRCRPVGALDCGRANRGPSDCIRSFNPYINQ